MNNYQVLFIIDIDTPDEEKTQLIDRFTELIVSLGGEIYATDKWGAKRFAYPINYKREGYYVLIKFSANADTPAEIDRQMRINESIVRQMITRI